MAGGRYIIDRFRFSLVCWFGFVLLCLFCLFENPAETNRTDTMQERRIRHGSIVVMLYPKFYCFFFFSFIIIPTFKKQIKVKIIKQNPTGKKLIVYRLLQISKIIPVPRTLTSSPILFIHLSYFCVSVILRVCVCARVCVCVDLSCVPLRVRELPCCVCV